MTYQQTERLNSYYTVTRYTDHLVINRRGITLAVHDGEAVKLWSEMAHAAEPAAVVDDFWVAR